MAVTRVTPGNKDPVNTVLKGLDNIQGVYPARTRNPDDLYVVRVLEPAYTREVRTRIGAPVAEKRNYLRLPDL